MQWLYANTTDMSLYWYVPNSEKGNEISFLCLNFVQSCVSNSIKQNKFLKKTTNLTLLQKWHDRCFI